MNSTHRILERPTIRSIKAVTEKIADHFDPDKIILFGSYAYGNASQDSDVDLLVIMKTAQRPVEQAVAIRQAVDFPFPLDLLVRTPEQVEKRLMMGDGFIEEIIRRGKVLYEAHHE